MINGGQRAYFQKGLLNFDAFLIICHFVRDSLWSYTWLHPSPDRLGLAVDTKSCWTLQVANEPVRIQYFPWNWACWFHCICATSMPDFVGTSFKQVTWLKFDFLKIVAGRDQENIGAAMFSSPQILSTAHIGIKCLLDWYEKGLVISFQFEILFSNAEWFHVGLRQEISVRKHIYIYQFSTFLWKTGVCSLGFW